MKISEIIKAILIVTVLSTVIVGILVTFFLEQKIAADAQLAARNDQFQTQEPITVTMYQLCIDNWVYLYQTPDLPKLGGFQRINGAKVACSLPENS